MAKFFIDPKLSDKGKEFLLTTLKPLLKQNNMLGVRTKLSNFQNEYQDVKAFLLHNLGEELYFKNSNEIFKAEFFHITSLEKIIIPEGIKRIDAGAFGLCKSLEYVFIPASVEVIEEDAFRGCNKLNSVEIEDGKKSSLYIADTAFVDNHTCKVYVNGDRLNFEPKGLLKYQIKYK